jgi:hypothetical protein
LPNLGRLTVMAYMLCMNCIYPLRIIPLATQNNKDTFYQAKTFSLKIANKFMVECYIFANELCNVLITSETLFKLITTLVSLVREPH